MYITYKVCLIDFVLSIRLLFNSGLSVAHSLWWLFTVYDSSGPYRLQHARLPSLRDLEFAQIHAHWARDALEPSAPHHVHWWWCSAVFCRFSDYFYTSERSVGGSQHNYRLVLFLFISSISFASFYLKFFCYSGEYKCRIW